MTKILRSLSISSIALATTIPAVAQSDSASNNRFSKELDEVVVTGQYKPQSLQKSVYQVRVISGQQIELTGAVNLQQALTTQLGFRFQNDNALGISDVQLNGMGGTNVKILLDGVPMVDRYDQRVSLSQIDVSNIERIEIVEGPMSVSYGTDAMAGVINIITKKIEKNSFSVAAGAQEETSGTEYYPFSYKGVHLQHLNVNYGKNKWIASIGGTHNDFDGWGGDQYGRGKTWRPKEQWLGNGSIGYLGDDFQLTYRLNGLNENIVTRPMINMGNYKVVDQQFVTNRYVHQLQGQYRLNEKMQLNGFAAYTNYDRQTKTIRRNFLKGTTEPNQPGEDDLSKLSSFAFKTSLQYMISPRVSLQPGIDINHEKASGDRIEGAPAINDYALFVSAELQPTTFMKLRPGVRFSSNSEYKAPPAIPSLNTKFTLSKNFDLRLAYGYGFRAPTLRELYLTFVDANHNLIGNRDLKAEYANSVNGSLTLKPIHWSDVMFGSTLSGFYTAYHNQVNLVMSHTNSTEYTYYNIDRSKTAGGSLENTLAWKNLQVTIGVSYYGYASSQYDDKNYVKEDNRNFLWTPEVLSDVTYKLDKLKTTLALFYKYTGKKPAFSFGSVNGQDAILLTQTSGYNLADFSVNTDVASGVTAKLGVKNIFDVTNVTNDVVSTSNTSHSSAGALAMGYGRSFFVGLNFTWNKK